MDQQVKEAPVGTIKALAGFAAAARPSDLSDLARLRVREHLMDTVGVALAGGAEPGGRIIAKLFAGEKTSGTARVLGTGQSVAVWDATWVNGSFANMLDFDDTGFTHPSVCLVPAALAACEVRDLDGPRLMTALAVGYEICARMTAVIAGKFNTGLRVRGVHPMAVVGGIAAAAAAGNAMGLGDEQIEVAFGLAATASFGITEQFGTWAKGIQAGNVARAGVMGALLAEQDYYASKSAVDGRFGLLNALVGPGKFNLENGIVGLGERWAIAEPGADMKLHPACGGTRGFIQAAVKLREMCRSSNDEIERVVISVPEHLLDSLMVDRPVRGYGGKFSVRYPVAISLVDGDPTIDSFNDETLARPDVQAMMDRIEIEIRHGAGLDRKERHFTPMRVYCRSGKVIDETPPDQPRGMRKNRMTHEEIVSKYVTCASRMLQSDKVQRSLGLLERLKSTTARAVIDSVVP